LAVPSDNSAPVSVIISTGFQFILLFRDLIQQKRLVAHFPQG
jgi:hypothetical protein